MKPSERDAQAILQVAAMRAKSSSWARDQYFEMIVAFLITALATVLIWDFTRMLEAQPASPPLAADVFVGPTP